MKFTVLLAALATLAAASPAMPQGAEEHAAEITAGEPMAQVDAAEPMAQVDAAQPAGWGWCEPGTYRCSPWRNGWDVCNTSHKWVNGGSCGRRQYCYFNDASGSPYCYNYGTYPN